MLELTVQASEAGPESLRDLATRCVEYHADISNYFEPLTLQFRLLRRAGIDPHGRFGRLLTAAVIFLLVLLPAMALHAVASPPSTIAEAPLVIWLLLALYAGAGIALAPTMYATAARNHLAWLYAIVDEADLRRIHAWQRRWFATRVTTPVFITLALVVTLIMAALLDRTGTPVRLGSLYVGYFVLAMLLHNAFSMLLVVFETRQIAASKTDFFSLGPADSLPVRQTLRGFNQLGLINVFLFTPSILGLLLLLPGDSRLAAPVVVALLVFEFTYTALGALVPRVILGQPVRRAKEEHMRRLQRSIDELVPRLPDLQHEEQERLKSLHATYTAVRDSSENLLPLGAVLRTLGALLLSAITVVLTAFAQRWIEAIVARVAP